MVVSSAALTAAAMVFWLADWWVVAMVALLVVCWAGHWADVMADWWADDSAVRWVVSWAVLMVDRKAGHWAASKAARTAYRTHC